MGRQYREQAAQALILLAARGDYRDRADAGAALARFAALPQTWEPLLALVLDAEDTAVTLEVAEALLRRRDVCGLRLVARALAQADEGRSNWIHTAVIEVFGVSAAERDAAVLICEQLAEEDAARVGAGRLRDLLSAITPVLFPTVP
ncbi:hypothetical protein [Kineosporia babensis]|uniref:Uncharacterized protein n=1 Tax=Kineosporia babensis TaxID=499548 RepID=A0A9X1NKW8_9ACTN|nr:hypothetical protein [Kineosporia babensis]MCD5314988.1 hypothetical protein [Kineosporia babensis]